MQDKTPKVFISYSWSSDEMVLDLANRLMAHGVDVVLDKWNLKEGQDKYAFMEQCVNNKEIDKVLIICDRVYAEKANNRIGGVGDETVIISSEIYGNVDQQKFIPVIVEVDDAGQAYLPTYIKSRIYIDMSDDNKYEMGYEQLLRNIYEMPIHKKPPLGQKPEWLEEDRANFFVLTDIVKQIRGCNNEKKQQMLVQQFFEQYVEILKTYHEKDTKDGETVYNTFIEMKRIRDCFLDFLDVYIFVECDQGTVLGDFFEKMYNTLTCVSTFKQNSCGSHELECYKIHIWELFICTIAFYRHYEHYRTLNKLLDRTYFLNTSELNSNIVATNYSMFRHYSSAIEDHYKPQTEHKNKFTLTGNTLCCEREKLPIYTKEKLAQADLFLYQVYNAFELHSGEVYRRDTYWFPTCYVYTSSSACEWQKMKSLKYCEKMFELFNVKDVTQLKEKLSRCVVESGMGYRGSFESASAILQCIKMEDIGSIK